MMGNMRKMDKWKKCNVHRMLNKEAAYQLREGLFNLPLTELSIVLFAPLTGHPFSV